jgi:drug/metabolite transporter (DMT)-like permease
MFFVAMFWGLNWPVGRKVAIAELGPVPFTAAFLRFTIAIPFLFLAAKLIERPPSFRLERHLIKPVFILGILQVSLHNFFFLSGLRYTSGSDGVLIINGGITVFTALFAAKVYSDEKLTRNKILGMAVAIFGVTIIFLFSPNTDVENRILGNLLILCTAIVWSSYTVFSRPYHKQISPFHFQFWASFFGWIILAFLALSEQVRKPTTHISSATWWNLTYMGVFAAAIAYTLFNISVKHIGPSRTSIFINLVPMFGIIFSVILIGEAFSVWYVLAFLIILLGIYIVELNPNRSGKNSESTK